MADGDARTADEIRAGGDEMSVLNAYTETFTGNSQPGQVNADGNSIHGDYDSEDWRLTADEDDERWYSDEPEDSYEPEPLPEVSNTREIAQQAAADWARASLDPNTAMAQQFVDGIDHRIQQQLDGVRQAQEWAAQGEAERAQRAELYQAQQEANDQEVGSARLEEIAQSTATRQGLPVINPEEVRDYADQLYSNQVLAYMNAYSTPEEAQAALDRDAIAKRCVEQAAIDLGRSLISHNALKRI